MPFDEIESAEEAWALHRRRRRGRQAAHFGGVAEAAVRRRYESRGWVALAANWRASRVHGGGELDLVMRHGDLLSFVEVKARRRLDEALWAVAPAQVGRLRRAATQFVQDRGIAHLDMRFDLAACDPFGRIKVICNAFHE